jgi:hypothetical protein
MLRFGVFLGNKRTIAGLILKLRVPCKPKKSA